MWACLHFTPLLPENMELCYNMIRLHCVTLGFIAYKEFVLNMRLSRFPSICIKGIFSI